MRSFWRSCGDGMRHLAFATAVLGTLLLAGCYTSETVVVEASDGIEIAGISEGVYRHAENRLLPPQVGGGAADQRRYGRKRCRDLRWDADAGSYRDELSPRMIFRVGDLGVPGLMLLQTQTGPAAKARLAPIAVTDGMFMMFDPAGAWPEDPSRPAG